MVMIQGFEADNASKLEYVMKIGKVKWFNPSKGFGFVLTEDGIDVFVHYTDIDQQEGFRYLRTGQIVEFAPVQGEKGLRAKDLRVVAEQDESNNVDE